MINEFKKYDKKHTRLITINISEFNELIKETNICIKTKWDYELEALASMNDLNKRLGVPELSYNEYKSMYGSGVGISILNNRNDNIPATITIGKHLGLKHVSLQWNAFDGNKLDMEYKI